MKFLNRKNANILIGLLVTITTSLVLLSQQEVYAATLILDDFESGHNPSNWTSYGQESYSGGFIDSHVGGLDMYLSAYPDVAISCVSLDFKRGYESEGEYIELILHGNNYKPQSADMFILRLQAEGTANIIYDDAHQVLGNESSSFSVDTNLHNFKVCYENDIATVYLDDQSVYSHHSIHTHGFTAFFATQNLLVDNFRLDGTAIKNNLVEILPGTGLTGGGLAGSVTLSLADLGVTTNKIANSAVTTAKLDSNITAGWLEAGETWIFNSADDPTYAFNVTGDKTSKYTPGMKVKLTQNTDKYFIITNVSYSAPNTTIDVYGGTDFDLSDEAITSPFYSTQKSPYGFPLESNKWTVAVTDTTDLNQSNPTNDTWYNLGNLSIEIPIGCWNSSYELVAYASRSAGSIDQFVTLSEADNSESDKELTFVMLGSTLSELETIATKSKQITVNSKTNYYLNTKTTKTNIDALSFKGTLSPTKIKAVSCYL